MLPSVSFLRKCLRAVAEVRERCACTCVVMEGNMEPAGKIRLLLR